MVTKHGFNGRIDGLNDAAIGVEGDDAVHHGIQNGLDQGSTVACCLLHGIFCGHVAKYQHSTDHFTIMAPDGGATVGNVVFVAIAGQQYGVIGKALHRAMQQSIHDRNGHGLTSVLVDDLKNVADLAANGLCTGPTGQLLGQWIKTGHTGIGIGRDHRIADRIERDSQLLFTGLQA